MLQKITKPTLPLLNAGLKHPFVTQLLQRQLPESSLDFYLSQDMIYLESLGKLLTKISSRLTSSQDKLAFDQLAPDTVHAEQKMREVFNIKRPLIISPVIKNYLAHLTFYTTYPDLAVCIAAHMPCPFFYQKIGELVDLKQLKSSNCRQSRLLASYVKPNFHHATGLAIETMLKLIDPTDEENVVNKMSEVFKLSTQYELAFLDECYAYRSQIAPGQKLLSQPSSSLRQ